MSRAKDIEAALTTQELIEMIGDPELVTQILLEVEGTAEPQVSPSEPGEDLDLAYFKKRRQLIRQITAQQMHRARRVQ